MPPRRAAKRAPLSADLNQVPHEFRQAVAALGPLLLAARQQELGRNGNSRSRSALQAAVKQLSKLCLELDKRCDGAALSERCRQCAQLVFCSDAWPQLLDWLSWSAERLEAAGAAAVGDGSAAGPNAAVGGGAPTPPARGGSSGARLTALQEDAHLEAIRVLYCCIRAAAVAADPDDAATGATAATGQPPAPPPGLDEGWPAVRALRTLVLSHSLLHRHSRLLAQAADAAAGAAADMMAAAAAAACARDGSSFDHGGGGSCATGGSEGGGSGAVVTSSRDADGVGVQQVQQQLERCLLHSNFARRLLRLGCPTVYFASTLCSRTHTQQSAALPRAAGAAAAAAAAAGAASGGGGVARGNQAQLQQDVAAAQPLWALWCGELAASGFLDQAARLMLYTAAAKGASVMLRAAAPVQRRLEEGGGGGGATVNGASAPAAKTVTVNALCEDAALIGTTWIECAAEDAGGGSGESACVTCATTTRGSSMPQRPPPPLFPVPWGACLQTLALAQVVATLGAAGFGGGRGGVWGLPAELAAGLPLLSPPLLATRTAGSSSSGAVYASSSPMRLLITAVEMELQRMQQLRRAAALPSAAAAAAAAAAAQLNNSEAADGVAPASSSSSTAAGPAAVMEHGQHQRPQQQTQEDAPCWAFPISPRALTELLLQVADLAVASIDNAAAAGSSSSGSNDGGGGSSAGQPPLQLAPANAWSVGLRAVVTAQRVLHEVRSREAISACTRGAGGSAAGAAAAAAAGPAGAAAHPADSSSSSGSSSVAAAGGVSELNVPPPLPPLPRWWWQRAVAILRRSGGVMQHGSMRECDKRDFARLMAILHPSGAEVAELPPVAPRGLTAALAAGLLPALEAAVRELPAAAREDAMCALVDALCVHDGVAKFLCGAGWPLLQQLLAFAPPAQAAALVTSLGKWVQAVALQGPACAATGALPGVFCAMSILNIMLPDMLGGTIARSNRSSNSNSNSTAIIAGNAEEGCVEGDDEHAAAAASPHEQRLQLLVSHMLHRCLPALSCALRQPLSRGIDAHDVACGHALATCLLHAPMMELVRHEAAAAAATAAAATDAAATAAPAAICSSGDKQQQQQQQQASNCGRGRDAGSAGIPASSPAAAAAATAGSSGTCTTSVATAAAAAAASWRQWLLHDVQLLPLLESGLRLLAAMPAGGTRAHDLANQLTLALVGRLLYAVPDALAAALAPPLPAGSPWQPALLPHLLQRHLPELVHELPRFWELAALTDTAENIRSRALGGPEARWQLLQQLPSRIFRTYPFNLLSPYEAEVEAEIQAAAAAAAAGSGSCGGGGGGSSSSASAAAASVQPPTQPLLRCCANPACTNLAGRSEAELPLSACAGCKRVWYCGRACQTAHWRGGHKAACALFRAAETGTGG